jgi:hypothetical protein
MAEGRAARDKGDLQGALKAFSAADSIMHVPTTGLELARTQASLGQLLEARETTLRVLHIPQKPNEPTPFKNAREASSSLNEELEARVPSLKIVVTGVPEGVRPRVTLDGAMVPPELLGQPRKLNPGHHVVVAKAASTEETREIDVNEREAKQVSVDLPQTPPEPPAPVIASGPEPAKEEARPQEPPTLARALVYGGFSLAGAGLVAGAIAGAVSLSKTSGIRNSGQCLGDRCGPVEYGEISAARSMATISNVSFVAAGLGAAAGVVGLLLSPPEPKADNPIEEVPSPKTAQVRPWIGFGALGLSGEF